MQSLRHSKLVSEKSIIQKAQQEKDKKLTYKLRHPKSSGGGGAGKRVLQSYPPNHHTNIAITINGQPTLSVQPNYEVKDEEIAPKSPNKSVQFKAPNKHGEHGSQRHIKIPAKSSRKSEDRHRVKSSNYKK